MNLELQRAKNRKRSAETRRLRLESGLCPRCGEARDDSNYIACGQCRRVARVKASDGVALRAEIRRLRSAVKSAANILHPGKRTETGWLLLSTDIDRVASVLSGVSA